MKEIILLLTSLISINSFATCRALSKEEVLNYNLAACKYFQRIYEDRVSMDLAICAKKSRFSICENEPLHGTYIYGKLVTGDKKFDCNMEIIQNRIMGADCGDE